MKRTTLVPLLVFLVLSFLLLAAVAPWRSSSSAQALSAQGRSGVFARSVAASEVAGRSMTIERLRLQQGLDGYEGVCDTFIDGRPDHEGENYCEDLTLLVHPEYDAVTVGYTAGVASLIRFDLEDLPEHTTLPDTARVISASLRLRATTQVTPPVAVSAYEVLRPWDCGLTSWITASTESRWVWPGCNHDSDRYLAPLDRVLVSERGQFYYFDVTEVVQRWLDVPSLNQGIVLKNLDEEWRGACEFASSETESGSAELRPMLIIDYVPVYTVYMPVIIRHAPLEQFSAPTPLVPCGGEKILDINDVEFTWSGGCGSCYVELWGPVAQLSSGWISGTSWNGGLLPPGSYQWRVKCRERRARGTRRPGALPALSK